MPAAICPAACGRRTARTTSASAQARARAVSAPMPAGPGHDRPLAGQIDPVDHLGGGGVAAERGLQKL